MRKLIAVVVVLLIAFAALVDLRERPAPAADVLELPDAPRLVYCGGRYGGYRRVMVRRPSGVDPGLHWLARHQQRDGCWDPLSLAACCSKTTCTGANAFVDRERATALVLLAFLGAGHARTDREIYTDRVDGRVRCYGKILRDGRAWLVSRQHEDGRVGDDDALSVSRHALATLALAESAWRSGLPEVRAPVKKAIAWLEAARSKDGGWGFTPRAPMSDSLVTRRALLALARARDAGFDVTTKEATAACTDWSLLDEGPTPSWKELEKLQEGRSRGCAEGSWAGNEGRVVETAWAVLRMELGLRYDVPTRRR